MDVFISVFSELLPSVFSLSDSLLIFLSTNLSLVIAIVNILKLIMAIVIFVFVAYVYFVRQEKTRAVNNKVELWLLGFTMMITSATAVVAFWEYQKKKEANTPKVTSTAG